MAEIDQLIKMANQVADNFSFHDDNVDRIADHLSRFWAPSMIQGLLEYVRQGGDGVSRPVLAALGRVKGA
jgi:NADPH-dependent 7-cyano-7-deazaguanine reductase QueF